MNKLILKYKNMPIELKAGYWYAVSNIFQKGSVFIAMPIYTKFLTTYEYGIYSIYNTWFNIIFIVASLSLSAGFCNVEILKYKKEKSRFLSSIQGLSTTTTIIVIGVCYLFQDKFYILTGFNNEMLFVISAHLIFSNSFLYWTVKQKSEYKYIGVGLITIISSITTVLLSIAFIFILNNKSDALIFANAIVQIIIGSVFFIYNFYNGRCFFDREIWKYAFFAGITLIPHYLSYVVLSLSDRIMIDSICGTSDAGIYSLASNISMALNIIAIAIDGSLSYWVIERLKSRDYINISKITNYVIFAFGCMVIICSLIGPELISIVATKDYREAKWVMPPIIAGCYFLYLAGNFMRIEFYHEKHNIITIASILTATLNIVLNIIFIPIFGYIAAAYTTMFSYMVLAIIHYVMVLYICKRNNYKLIPFDMSHLALISIIIILFNLFMVYLYQYTTIRYLIFFILMILLIVNYGKIRSIKTKF